MRHPSFASLLAQGAALIGKGPVALILAEDGVEVASTLDHHLKAGFGTVICLCPDAIDIPAPMEARLHRVTHDVHAANAMATAVTALNSAAAPGTWIYYCFNSEYLFFPFSETRSVGEMLTFHTEERRDAMIAFVVDLYAADLDRNPDAVARDQACIDRSGYFALARKDAAKDWAPKDRQLDFFGGLRWRFEEHIPTPRRKIDRVALFRSKPGLVLSPEFTFSDQEYNTYACPWHHNLTAAICSFRTAKALRANPGSRYDIRSFHWYNSVPFEWHSQQLMDLGLMEPGQWF
ncbi:MAG: glycosyltransferase family 2 protein [Pseudomonadota bacterium]